MRCSLPPFEKRLATCPVTTAGQVMRAAVVQELQPLWRPGNQGAHHLRGWASPCPRWWSQCPYPPLAPLTMLQARPDPQRDHQVRSQLLYTA